MDRIMDSTATAGEREAQKITARAYADAIDLIMGGGADWVSAEAKRRYDARMRGDTAYETPGLAEEVYVPPTPAPRASAGRTTTPRRTGKHLDPALVPQLTEAIKSGMFTVDQIASSYGLSPDELKEQLGLETTGQGGV
jgi:hypothetical protein